MVDFGKFDKMIKISGNMEKCDTYKEVSSDISFFIETFLQILSLNLKKFINKERNITSKLFVRVFPNMHV